MNTKNIARLAAITYLVVTAKLGAQTDSRLAEMAVQQEQKAAQVKPDEPSKLEHALVRFQESEWLKRYSAGVGGFKLKIGGMGDGTSFGVGPLYSRTGLLGGQFNLRAGAQTSFRGDRKFDLELAAPEISGGRYFMQLYAVH